MELTKQEKKMEALGVAAKEVSVQTIEDLEVQGRAVAANSLLLYGKKCLEPSGFVYAVETATEVALYWLLAEGYVTLTEKAQATDEEKAERAASKAGKSDTLKQQAEQVFRGQYI